MGDSFTTDEEPAPIGLRKRLIMIPQQLVALLLWNLACTFPLYATHTAAEAKVLVEQWSCTPSCAMYGIAITGPIDGNTRSDLAKATQDQRIKDTNKYFGPFVRLNSAGGSVRDAMTAGEFIRNSGLSTAVFENDECDSACILVLAGGVKRIATWGKIGIHRPHFPEELFARLSHSEAQREYNEMADGVRQYLSRMGLPDSLYAAMMRVPSDKVRYLVATEIKAFGLDGEDSAWAEWHRAKMIESQGQEQYEIDQSLLAVIRACANKFDDVRRCVKEINPEFHTRVAECTRNQNGNYLFCVNQVQRRMVSKYQ